jgi:amino acid permease
MTNLIWTDEFNVQQKSFGTTKACWVICLSIALAPFVLMKELGELKALSIALFYSLILFISMNLIQIPTRGNELQNPDSDYSMYWQGSFGNTYISAFIIIFTSVNF